MSMMDLLTASKRDEVLFDKIMVRLPVLSIIRCKSVCKSWCFNLSTPEFMSSRRDYHRRKFPATAAARLKLYPTHSKIYRYNHDVDNQLISYHKINELELPRILCLNDNSNDYNAAGSRSRKRKREPSTGSVYEFLGHCDGMACFLFQIPHTNFQPYSEKILLWDLTLEKTTLTLPSSYNYFSYGCDQQQQIMFGGIGYDENSTHDYKIIRASLWPQQTSDTVMVQANVYSLNSNTWRSFGVTLPRHGCSISVRCLQGTQINGVLYWSLGTGSSLLTFCLATEVFDHIPIPDEVIGTSLITLDIGGEHKLGLFNLNRNTLTSSGQVWVMLDDTSKSWAKLCDIDFGARIQPPIKFINHQFLVTKFAADGQCFVFDLIRNCNMVPTIFEDDRDEVQNNDRCLCQISLH